MDEQAKVKLLPMTILDGMILVAGCAVSAYLFKIDGPSWHWFPPKKLFEWVLLTEYLQYGVTITAPVVIGMQYLRGRRGNLAAGEIAWLVIAIELMPYCIPALIVGPKGYDPEHDLLDRLWGWYVKNWLVYVSPPLVSVCGLGAVAWHFRTARPWPWSHRFGIGVSLAQCVPSALLMVGWFVGIKFLD